MAAKRKVLSSKTGSMRWLVMSAALGAVGSIAAPARVHAQVGPEASLKTFTVMPGIECKLFASEPMFSNPCDMDIDAKGRVWVTEGVNYRGWQKLRPEGDRLMVLEDTDGDGKADKATVVWQSTDINAALGVLVLPGNKALVSDSPNVFLISYDPETLKITDKKLVFTGISGHQHDHGMHTFVPGPDGKLYFNYGNEGKQLKGPDGKELVDMEGNAVVTGRKDPASKSGPYRMGMVFRMNPDGTELEVLGWNFRNNYEVNIDSFGTMWQSDNDDDGNRGVRINYVMEYGNYGYSDEITGAGWNQNRTNIEAETPHKHWHLNDPGVMPNLLQTGGGSPTGIILYEGTLLPPIFHNAIVHCEPGANEVHLYPVQPDGAGFKVTVPDEKDLKVGEFKIGEQSNKWIDVIKAGDRWFRPSDVCVAPDGSLIVADWYDPGVGGHAMGDNKYPQTKGRLFRLAPPNTPYKMPTFDYATAAGAVEALKNPNKDVQFMAWTALHAMGAGAEAELQKLLADANPKLKARALWLLAKINGKEKQYVDVALKDADSNIRIVGIRVARQLHMDMIPIVKQLLKDPSPQVRRDCAIALRHSKSSEAADLWAELALQHDGKDRWYLEALGLAADRNEDAFTGAYLNRIGDKWNTPAARDIIWRSRGTQVPGILARIILDPGTTDRARYLRAFDFLPASDEKDGALASLIDYEGPDKGMVAAEALSRLKGKGGAIAAKVNKILNANKGTPEFLNLVEMLDIRDRDADVLAMAIAHSADQSGANAMRILLKNGDMKLVEQALAGKDSEAVVTALGNAQDKKVADMLAPMAADAKRSLELRQGIVRAMARSTSGAAKILDMVKKKQLADDLTPTLARELNGSAIVEVRNEAKRLFPLPPTKDGKPLPPLAELMKMPGDASKGNAVWKANCAQCHQIKNEGTNFGPALTEIGSKYGKDALFTNILFPSQAIEHNFAGHVIRTRGGDDLVGIIQSETADEVVLRQAGGVLTPIKRTSIRQDREMKESIMPEQLQANMTIQEFVDLVSYLETLKKGQ
jgi:putative membrane-bound dehydrogenase-like protein